VFNGVRVLVSDAVYEPSHDSYLLVKALNQAVHHGNEVALDIGCGACPEAVYLARRGHYVIAVDVNPCALTCCARTAHSQNLDALIDVVQCFSAMCIRSSCIDIAVFNPPYLPCSDDSTWLDVAVCGGEEGVDALKAFINDALVACRRRCTIVFVLSSLQNLERVARELSQCSELEILDCIPFFYEELCSAVCRVRRC